jgi:hypothetical protein
MADIAPISSGPSRIPEVCHGVGETRAVPGRQEPAARPSDRVELSDRARFLSKLAQPLPIRYDLVDRVRQEIDAGVYDSADRLDQAVQALVEDLDLNA